MGYLYTYWLPLAFVIGVGLIREAVEDLIRYVKSLDLVAECYHKTKIILRKSTTDDYIFSNCRYSRDKELNSRRYAKLTPRGPVSIASKDLKVGDIVYVEKVNMHKNEIIIIWILVLFSIEFKGL